MSKYLDTAGLTYLWDKILELFNSRETMATVSGKILHVEDAKADTEAKSFALFNSSGTQVTGKSVAMANRNLFRIDLLPSSVTNKGVTFTKNADGSISASGTSTGTYASTTCNIDKNAFVTGKTYTLSCGKTSGILYLQLALTYSDGTTDYLVSSNAPHTFTISKTVTKVVGSVQITASGATVNQTIWPQIELANKASPFENNVYQTFTFNGSNLPTLPDTITNIWSNDDSVTNINMTYVTDMVAYLNNEIQKDITEDRLADGAVTETKLAEMSTLATTDKTVVGAINEVNTNVNGITEIPAASIDAIFS